MSKKFENVSIFAHFTSHKNVYDYDKIKSIKDMKEEEIKQEETENINIKKKRNQAKIGRASFKDVLNNSPKHSTVFFCGSPMIQKHIKTICKNLGFAFFEGHTF